MPEIVFGLAPRQNHFFVEIVDALRLELGDLGVETSICDDGVPAPDPDRVVVLVPPHEWFALTPPDRHPAPPELERAIFLCAEQPGTWFFDEDVRLAHLHGAAVLDVNPSGVAAFREEGIWAEHAPLGWTRAWACAAGASSTASATSTSCTSASGAGAAPRSSPAAPPCSPPTGRASCSRTPTTPTPSPRPTTSSADDKWALLRRSRVLLNLHVDDRRYFEWQRVVQAIGHGAVVISDHSEGVAPLEPGAHFLAARPDALGDRRRGAARRRAAPPRDGPRRLRRCCATSCRCGAPPSCWRASPRSGRACPSRRAPPSAAPGPAAPRRRGRARQRFPSLIEDEETGKLRAALKDVRLQLLDQRRDARAPGQPARRAVERVAESPGLRDGRRRPSR